MFVISHRGNIDGPKPEKENSLPYIMEAITRGFYVEVDVRINCNRTYFWLGHDAERYKVDGEFLTHPNIICHAKDINTFYWFHKNSNGKHRYFFHETDNITVVFNLFRHKMNSLGPHQYLWTANSTIDTPVSFDTILVNHQRDLSRKFVSCWGGICTDYANDVSNFERIII